MQHRSLSAVREVHRSLDEWLSTVQTGADPASDLSGTVRQISCYLQRVDQAIHEANPSLGTSLEWQQELASYAGTLRELQARLMHLEIALRIRHRQMLHARSRLGTLHSWAKLAEQIG
jgi:hypothetical protein